MKTFKERLRTGEFLRGTFLNLGSALVAEVLALSGFDWLLVDLEHGSRSEDALIGQLLAGAAHDVPVFARVESAARIRAGHILDLGTAGVMFPRLDDEDEAREALSHLFYPPQGDRGIATYNRARAFGGDGRDVGEVNESLVGIVQIESASALSHVEAIGAVPGVDALFVGPADLSHALGVPGQLDAPEFLEALERVVNAARRSKVAAGIFCPDVTRVDHFRELGFTFVAVASDSALLRSAALGATTPR